MDQGAVLPTQGARENNECPLPSGVSGGRGACRLPPGRPSRAPITPCPQRREPRSRGTLRACPPRAVGSTDRPRWPGAQRSSQDPRARDGAHPRRWLTRQRSLPGPRKRPARTWALRRGWCEYDIPIFGGSARGATRRQRRGAATHPHDSRCPQWPPGPSSVPQTHCSLRSGARKWVGRVHGGKQRLGRTLPPSTTQRSPNTLCEPTSMVMSAAEESSIGLITLHSSSNMQNAPTTRGPPRARSSAPGCTTQPSPKRTGPSSTASLLTNAELCAEGSQESSIVALGPPAEAPTPKVWGEGWAVTLPSCRHHGAPRLGGHAHCAPLADAGWEGDWSGAHAEPQLRAPSPPRNTTTASPEGL